MTNTVKKLEYYYENEAEQFVFYRVPKILFKDKHFSKISSDAKLLYSLLLDRMSLSRKNGWVDEEKRVYIYFSIEEVMEEFSVASQKADKNAGRTWWCKRVRIKFIKRNRDKASLQKFMLWIHFCKWRWWTWKYWRNLWRESKHKR